MSYESPLPGSVPSEALALFETINSTRSDINKAKNERVSLARRCNADSFVEWDRSVRETETALKNLEKLVEPMRLDLNTNNGKVRTATKLRWAVKSSKIVPTANDRLNIAHSRMMSAKLMIQWQIDQERKNNHHVEAESATTRDTSRHEAVKRAVGERRKEDRERTMLSKSPDIMTDFDNTDVGADHNTAPTGEKGNGLRQEPLQEQRRTRLSAPSYENLPQSTHNTKTSSSEAPLSRQGLRTSPVQDLSRQNGPFMQPEVEYMNHSASLLLPDDISEISASTTQRSSSIDSLRRPATGVTLPNEIEVRQSLAPDIHELEALRVGSSTTTGQARIATSPRHTQSHNLPIPHEPDLTDYSLDESFRPVYPLPHHQKRLRGLAKPEGEQRTPTQATNRPERPRPPYPVSPAQKPANLYPTTETLPLSTAHTPITQSAPRQTAIQNQEVSEFRPNRPRRFREYNRPTAMAENPVSSIDPISPIRTVQHSFPGHRQAMNVRWQPGSDPSLPDLDETSRSQTPQSAFMPPPLQKHSAPQGEVYQAYRPSQDIW